MSKCAVFCSKGLGDGLLFLIVSNNLKNNNLSVTTYHDFLGDLNWFQDLEIKKYPKIEDIERVLSSYDLVIVNTDSCIANEEIQKYLINNPSKKSYFLHATTCKGKNLPGNYYLDRNSSMVSNLEKFCKDELKVASSCRENGIFAPKELSYRKYRNRIVIHPTSKSEVRNWPQEKFLKLSHRLQNDGFSISYIVPEEEREEWAWVNNHGICLPKVDTLEKLASYIYESAFFLGNDSGVGHLASCLKIPTFTIFSSRRKQLFWRPDWHLGDGISPLGIIPNFKGLRLREKFWKFFVEEYRVYRKFSSFIKSLN